MQGGINERQDGDSYDCIPYMPDSISDANNLYNAWIAAKKDSDWKAKVQIFEMDWLSNISKLQKEIKNRTYTPDNPTEFIIRERGKERYIYGEQIKDRVVEHSLNDNVVIPSITPYLIYDNGASLKDKGIGFTRERLVKHLVNYYHKYGNKGYVLLIDFRKYYDNIHHAIVSEQFKKYISDPTALWLLDVIIKGFEVDVSYMTDKEYEHCMENVYDSFSQIEIDPNLLTGEKMMPKHLDIGNQTSQSAGILYPTPLDNYIKILHGVKYYGRYMDDAYILHPDRKYLESLLQDIIQKADECGIIINQDKTHIARISDKWKFLQIHYSLTNTGRIVRKINPKRITTQRRKMKILASRMTVKEYKDWVHSWVRGNRKYMSRKQYENIMELYSKEVKQCIR